MDDNVIFTPPNPEFDIPVFTFQRCMLLPGNTPASGITHTRRTRQKDQAMEKPWTKYPLDPEAQQCVYEAP